MMKPFRAVERFHGEVQGGHKQVAKSYHRHYRIFPGTTIDVWKVQENDPGGLEEGNERKLMALMPGVIMPTSALNILSESTVS